MCCEIRFPMCNSVALGFLEPKAISRKGAKLAKPQSFVSNAIFLCLFANLAPLREIISDNVHGVK